MHEAEHTQTLAMQTAGGTRCARRRARALPVRAAMALCLMMTVILYGLAIGAMAVPAFAAGQSTQNQGQLSGSVDPDATGSITLTMRTTKGALVPGGQVAVYQVGQLASVDGGYRYEYVTAFSSASQGLTSDNIEHADTTYLNELVRIARETQATGKERIGSDGSATFSNLPVGVYLVVQTKAASGYQSTNPFLVTIPFDGAYDVNATPKVDPVSPNGSSTTSKSTSSSSSESSSGSSTSVVSGGGGGAGGNGGASATLPQTGQLWWPVCLLSVVGVALIVAGLVRNRREEARHGA